MPFTLRTKAAIVLSAFLFVTSASAPFSAFSDGGADLSVSVAVQPSVAATAPMVLAVTIHNAGPEAAPQPIARGLIPEGYAFDGSASRGCVGSSFGPEFVCLGIGSPLEAGMDYVYTVYAKPVRTFDCQTVVSLASVSVESVPAGNDPDMTNNVSAATSFTITCPVEAQPPQADLSLHVSADATLDQSAPLALRLTVHNAGPQPASQTVIRGNLPAGYAFNGSTSLHCVGSSFGQDFVCLPQATALPAGEDRVYTVYANPVSTLACGAVISIPAAHVEASFGQADPDMTNNEVSGLSSTITCPVPPMADMSVTLTGSSIVAPGGTMTYAVTVKNNGPTSASAVQAVLPVPLGLTFQQPLSSPSCVQNGANVVCTNSLLQSGDVAVSSVVFSALESLECGLTFSAAATVDAAEPDAADWNNQSATVTTAVVCGSSSSSSSSSSDSSSSSSSSESSEPTGSSSSSSSSSINDINPNFNPPAPSTSSNTSSHRGHDTNILVQILRFITRGSTIAPPAFGGGTMTLADITEDQNHAICSMAKTLKYNTSDRMPAQKMIAGLLALQLGLPQSLVLDALQEPAFCS